LHIVELFLPIDRGDGSEVSVDDLGRVLVHLTNQFGGATAFTRSPAAGLWKQGTSVEHDRIVIIEVIVDPIDQQWWTEYRKELEEDFKQERILIRATPCDLL
jgi:hypothetical protein